MNDKFYGKFNQYMKVQFSAQWNNKMKVKQLSQEYGRPHLDTSRFTDFMDSVGL